jgi:pimeloyl-ACP methyl ester carboxylesterase
MTEDWQQLRDSAEYVTVDGVDVRYVDHGEGDTLFLMHGGGLTSTGDLSYGAVIDPLSERCRVVAADQPGFGFTPARDERDADPKERAEFMLRTIEELDLAPVTVTGHSRSGFMAAYMALTRPDLVAKLVIVAAGSASRKLLPDERPGDLSAAEPSREAAREWYEDTRESAFTTTDHHPFWRGPVTDEKVEYLYEIQRRNWEFTQRRHEANQVSAAALNEALSHDGRHTTEFAPDIEQPTLLTWSTKPYPGWPPKAGEPDDDDLEPKRVTVEPDHIDAYERDEGLENGLRLFESIPNAEIHAWHDAKHSVMTDRAPRWADVVAGFVTT